MIAADTTEKTIGLGLLVSAYLFGFRHGIDWDHLAAITDIVSSQSDRRSALFFGTLYALGHALVIFVLGSAAILLSERLPAGIDTVMQRIVGATLIVLGVYVIVGLIRHGREFRLRSRWMLIFSGIRNVYRRIRPGTVRIPDLDGEPHDHEHEPVHSHAIEGEGDVALGVAVADDIPVSQWHHGHHGRPGHHHHKHPEPPDAFMNYGKATSFIVGMVHGVGAETATQLLIFVAAAGAGGALLGELVLVVFIAGLLTSNSLIVFGSSVGFLKAAENWNVYLAVALFTAAFSLVVGTLFLFGRGTLLPAIFGG